MSVKIEDLGTLLKVWRVMAGLSLDEAAAAASAQLPGTKRISRELVRRYESNQFPADGPETWVVVAMALATGQRVADLPEDVLRGRDLLAELLRKSCFPLSHLVGAA